MAKVLPEALARLRDEHPGIAIEVSTANAPAVLTRRGADIAARQTAAAPVTLIGRRICGLAYALYVAPAYLDQREPGMPLVEHHWIGSDDSLRETASARRMREAVPYRDGLKADSLLSIRALAAAGLGVALLPCYLGDDSSDLGASLWLLTHEDLRRTARIDAVIRSLASTLGAERARWEGRPNARRL